MVAGSAIDNDGPLQLFCHTAINSHLIVFVLLRPQKCKTLSSLGKLPEQARLLRIEPTQLVASINHSLSLP